jgi:hypothetical protein
MASRVGLYEYLGRPVAADRTVGSTHVTEAGDSETYDDQGLDGAGIPETLIADSTVISRNDSETYDDQPGLGALGTPLDDGTVKTFASRDTYDEDHGLGNVALLSPMEVTTSITKVSGETYDDAGLDGLGLPGAT